MGFRFFTPFCARQGQKRTFFQFWRHFARRSGKNSKKRQQRTLEISFTLFFATNVFPQSQNCGRRYFLKISFFQIFSIFSKFWTFFWNFKISTADSDSAYKITLWDVCHTFLAFPVTARFGSARVALRAKTFPCSDRRILVFRAPNPVFGFSPRGPVLQS